VEDPTRGVCDAVQEALEQYIEQTGAGKEKRFFIFFMFFFFLLISVAF
jgi:hypothetical protein